jgi:tetratricopeptide (TPR) repeat protein
MAETTAGPDPVAPARRGRREEALDVALPEHRVAFAERLRELRRECGQPPYRTLSALAHCGSGSLSEAASGRRFPTWETTRGYVTGCLRHAGRDADLALVLPRWRRAWDDAAVREQAGRLGPPPAATGPPPPPAHRPRWRRRPLMRAVTALVTVLTLLVSLAAAGATTRTPAPMSGLYNVLVVPFAAAPAVQGPRDALEKTLTRLVDRWATGEPAVEARRVTTAVEGPREPALGRLAARHRADIVLSGRLETAGRRTTVVIEFVLTDRVFGETPEFVGRHEIGFTEPSDVVAGNVELSRRLAEDAVRYLKAVVAFVRGLGRYALDDYPGAERELRAAEQELTTIVSDPRRGTARAAVILLLLGNTLDRSHRYGEAAEMFRRALAQRPDYARATLGLADALRASAGCDRGAEPVLRQALDHYRSALTARDGPLLAMKTRLGLGLTQQCLTIAGAGNRWAAADAEFTAVLRMQAVEHLTGEAGRQALRLAAEARAGQALTASLTAGGMRAAACGYEEALDLLARTGVNRPSLRARKLVFLHNLQDAYRAMGAKTLTRMAENRIRLAGGTP